MPEFHKARLLQKPVQYIAKVWFGYEQYIIQNTALDVASTHESVCTRDFAEKDGAMSYRSL
jgi:hypothetical protein